MNVLMLMNVLILMQLLSLISCKLSSSSLTSSSSPSSSPSPSSINIIAKRYGPPNNDYDYYKPNKYNDDDRGNYQPNNKNGNDDENSYYDPRSRSRVREGSSGSMFDSIGNISKNKRQAGAALLGIGMILSFLGVMLFFEGNLLRLGNICIILGIPLLLGPNKVRQFFMKESRMQASIITGLGILLVFTGRPRLGILCEIFGLLNLFGNMFPLLLALARRLPIVGDVMTSLEGKSSNKFKPEF